MVLSVFVKGEFVDKSPDVYVFSFSLLAGGATAGTSTVVATGGATAGTSTVVATDSAKRVARNIEFLTPFGDPNCYTAIGRRCSLLHPFPSPLVCYFCVLINLKRFCATRF